jgi:transcriptional regulator with XRE-family HTH domain
MLQRLKQARKALGLNQSAFAKYLGLTQTGYSMIENGRNPLSERHIKVICKTFNISENWLQNGRGSMFSCSPYEKELTEILNSLEPETQEYLFKMAKELLNTQNKLINKNNKSDDEKTYNEKMQEVSTELLAEEQGKTSTVSTISNIQKEEKEA